MSGTTSSDSFRNVTRYQGQDYRFVPTYLRNRDPITPAQSPDIKPKENQGYYPVSSLWTNTTNGNVWLLSKIAKSITTINTVATWILITSGGSGPMLMVGVPLGTSPITPDVNGLINFTSTGGTVQITGSAGGTGLQDINFDITGGAVAIEKIQVDVADGTGVNPVVPSGGIITETGGQVAAGVVGTKVIRTHTSAPNQFAIEIQRSQAVASSTVADNGVSHFNSNDFTVDSDGFVSLKNEFFIGTATTSDGGGQTQDINVNFPVPNNSTVSIRGSIAGYSDNDLGLGGEVIGSVRNVGGVLTKLGPADLVKNNDATLSAWSADVTFSGTNAVVRVTGVTGRTIKWTCAFDAVTALKTQP